MHSAHIRTYVCNAFDYPLTSKQRTMPLLPLAAYTHVQLTVTHMRAHVHSQWWRGHQGTRFVGAHWAGVHRHIRVWHARLRETWGGQQTGFTGCHTPYTGYSRIQPEQRQLRTYTVEVRSTWSSNLHTKNNNVNVICMKAMKASA